MSDLPPLPADGPEAKRLEDLAAQAEAERSAAARRNRAELDREQVARKRAGHMRHRTLGSLTKQQQRAESQRAKAAALRERRKRRREKNKAKKRRRAAIRAVLRRLKGPGLISHLS